MCYCDPVLNLFKLLLKSVTKNETKPHHFSNVTVIMLALSVTLEVIISDICFHPVRKQNQRSPSPSIHMSVNLASVTVNSVLPWGCTYEVGRCEVRESGSQDLPTRC